MGFVGSFLGIFGFAIGIPFGLLLGFFLFVYSETKQVKVTVLAWFTYMHSIKFNADAFFYKQCCGNWIFLFSSWDEEFKTPFSFWNLGMLQNLIFCLFVAGPSCETYQWIRPNCSARTSAWDSSVGEDTWLWKSKFFLVCSELFDDVTVFDELYASFFRLIGWTSFYWICGLT